MLSGRCPSGRPGRGPRNGRVWDGDVRARSRRWFNACVPDDEIPGLYGVRSGLLRVVCGRGRNPTFSPRPRHGPPASGCEDLLALLPQLALITAFCGRRRCCSTCGTRSAPATSGWRGPAATATSEKRCCRLPPLLMLTAACRLRSVRTTGSPSAVSAEGPAPAGRRGADRCGRWRKHRRQRAPRREDGNRRAGRGR